LEEIDSVRLSYCSKFPYGAKLKLEAPASQRHKKNDRFGRGSLHKPDTEKWRMNIQNPQSLRNSSNMLFNFMAIWVPS
jgi:hypothetical protein